MARRMPWPHDELILPVQRAGREIKTALRVEQRGEHAVPFDHRSLTRE